MDVLHNICPVIFTITNAQAIKSEIVTDMEIIGVPVNLSKKEANMYRVFNTLFISAKMKLFKKSNDFFKYANAFPADPDSKSLMFSINKRKTVV